MYVANASFITPTVEMSPRLSGSSDYDLPQIVHVAYLTIWGLAPSDVPLKIFYCIVQI